MLEVLKYIWQLLQNLTGLFLLLWYKIRGDAERKDELSPAKGIRVYVSRFMPSGISLGKYIILGRKYLYLGDARLSETIKHEYGHCRQSVRLGILYLLLIGVPSLCGNIYDRVAHKKWTSWESKKWYYNQPWEKWADKLGGVERW